MRHGGANIGCFQEKICVRENAQICGYGRTQKEDLLQIKGQDEGGLEKLQGGGEGFQGRQTHTRMHTNIHTHTKKHRFVSFPHQEMLLPPPR